MGIHHSVCWSRSNQSSRRENRWTHMAIRVFLPLLHHLSFLRPGRLFSFSSWLSILTEKDQLDLFATHPMLLSMLPCASSRTAAYAYARQAGLRGASLHTRFLRSLRRRTCTYMYDCIDSELVLVYRYACLFIYQFNVWQCFSVFFSRYLFVGCRVAKVHIQ